MENEDSKTARLHDIQGEVTFEHVKFGYTPEKTIIHDFSAEVKPGQKIAIVGPTGAGKTTMVNLLMRFYEQVALRNNQTTILASHKQNSHHNHT